LLEKESLLGEADRLGIAVVGVRDPSRADHVR
jgi:hypothetical protein